MNKQNIFKIFNQLIKNIDDYKYVFDFENHYIKGCLHFKIKINYATKIKSGWQDSNLRPPGPKPGAITGLRYTPNKLR